MNNLTEMRRNFSNFIWDSGCLDILGRLNHEAP
jgi:hypothetical protein